MTVTNTTQLPNFNFINQPPKISNTQENSKAETYSDPLSKWPVRGLAYSNELGVAIGEIAPKLGALLWVPALMYFGADIYDKYKNQETNYNPSTKRALEQATFQALASVILPTVTVHAGQKIISFADRITKDGLSTNAKEETLNFIHDFINKSKLTTYENNFDLYYEKFNASLKTYIDDVKGEQHSKNIFLKIYNWLFSTKHPEALSYANKEKLMAYANNQLRSLIEMRSKLMNNQRPKDISNNVFNSFCTIQETFKKEFGEEHYLHKSAKYALKEQLNANIFKLKMFKTLGGFIALGAMIKPIDMFVEQTIMKKVVEPNIEKLNKINFKRKTENKN